MEGTAVVSLADLNAKLDTTKIRVIEGDIPTGDWIFNGQGMVFCPKPVENGETPEKVVVQLERKIKLTPRKAEEFGVLRQFASDMTPLGGAVAGASLLGPFLGPFSVMAGFAA